MPGADERHPSASGVTCPTCGTRASWSDNPYRPFCSRVCRLIDLGRWLDERYRIEAAPEAGEQDGETATDVD